MSLNIINKLATNQEQEEFVVLELTGDVTLV